MYGIMRTESHPVKYLYCSGLALILILFLSSCSLHEERIFKESRPSMYTIVTITVICRTEEQAQKAMDASFRELDRLAALMNFYSADSEISMINRQAGHAAVKVSRDTLDLLEKAVYVSEMTEGAFDVTVGPLVKLWDMQKKIVPDRKAVIEAKEKVGYRNIVLDKTSSTVFLRKSGAQIDLGGILKGYAADKVVEILKQNGLTSAIVAVGGEVRAIGRKPDGTPWMVGIQNPRQKSSADEISATIELSDKATSTSGDYNKYFEKDGVRYHHLLDPGTGFPSKNCGSTTIIAKDSTTADGFSKLFVLGPEKGLKVAKRLGFDVIYIDCNGGIVMSDGLKDKIRFVNN
jgi:thiamine biosynthesis lipoprotein